MNRTITGLGLLLLLVAIGLIASPVVLTGHERLTLPLEGGVFLLPVGITVVLYGASSPDPNATTVGGLFGNPDENELRRRLAPARPPRDVRYLPSPKEPVNCRGCYTLMPWDLAECPRCGRRRECRVCGKPLYYLSGGVRCLPCVRDEAYCSCPRVARPAATGSGPGRRSRGR